ncbi:hypothetical protein E3N88_13812 [Mikania micrantha]|uniref:Uncharacterized protein n=1 Tax=Mikania micrantha TaxID=192012 RepID=A0A5N6P009_9ASTR|nr:hypothetical protein E3N88_13812 [Mikania micrantha]
MMTAPARVWSSKDLVFRILASQKDCNTVQDALLFPSYRSEPFLRCMLLFCDYCETLLEFYYLLVIANLISLCMSMNWEHQQMQHRFGERHYYALLTPMAETDAEKRSQFAQKMESWKMALTEVTDLKGRDVKDRKESEFIKEVVADIHRRLRVPLSNTLPRLIGIDYEIEFVSSWLTDGSSCTADILTIVGMSGIGKTSLARHVFGLHLSIFDKSSFIEGINAIVNECSNRLLDLQKQLHGDISKKNELRVNDVIGYTSKIEYVLARKRVFIVLDDIGSLKELDALLGNKGLHPGSKVIVTTKDASLTKRCALLKSQVHRNRKEVLLNGLDKYDSLKLLCIHAFDSQNPKEDRDVTELILNACDINTRSGITNLVDRCLLRIGQNKELIMHQLVQEMGRDLVRQESPEKPWKRSRSCWKVGTVLRTANPRLKTRRQSATVCNFPSILKSRTELKAKRNMLGLALDMKMVDKRRLHGSFELKTESFSAMDNLMLLQLNYVQLNECFDNFPEELRWLCMHGSPFKSIPFDLPMENVVVLDMSYSNIEYFDMLYSNPQPPTKRQKGLIGSSSNDKRSLGSLKILDMSFCEQLHSVGGFSELPTLERLILTNCTGLIEVCESIEQCDDLVHIDLSYCYKLRKLPKSLAKLKKVQTLLLDGCSSRESQIEMGNVKVIPSYLMFNMISLLSSLRILSLVNNKLSNECFPMDLSCLALLEELRLDGNPIVSLPSCVRTLPRLERLHMNKCDKLVSIEHPPCTLRELSVYFNIADNPSIRKIKFDLEMPPFNFYGVGLLLSLSSFEIDGMVKIQGMENVEEKLLHSLGWIDLEFTTEKVFKTFTFGGRAIKCQTQMFYQFGVFSVFYKRKEMPKWINCRSKGPSISFTIPSSLKKLRGLNFFCIIKKKPVAFAFVIPVIKISNITKSNTWIYKHYIAEVYYDFIEENFEGGNECLCLLSHWMFGPNEMKEGDHIIVTVANEYSLELIFESGIGLVYDDGSMEEEDVLGYYKSWNHIIGGDLSPFQSTTGEYVLEHNSYRPFVYDRTSFKGRRHFC